MAESSANDSLTLAGLAAANGPWLGMRVTTLGQHSGLPLPWEVVAGAVESTSRVLGELLNAEGHLAMARAETEDPAVALGREQAEAHRRAGLPLAASLKVQRLLRRAYDDLVRESWVDRGSRARAHEDVERFFERTLVGLVAVWTGQSPATPDAAAIEKTRLLAQREDELRRALEAGQRLTLAVRQTRARADQALAELASVKEEAAAAAQAREAELAAVHQRTDQGAGALRAEYEQALAQARTSAQSEKQLLTSRIREMEEERSVLGARMAEMEMALAAHGDAETARLEAQEELARARDEADRAREKADRAREELQRLRGEAQDLRRQADQRAQAAGNQAEALRGELRALRESHAALASDAEAMRARLAETGSRLTEMRRAEEEEIRQRLDQAAQAQAEAQQRAAAMEERAARAEGVAAEAARQLQDISGRLAEQTQAGERARRELAAAAKERDTLSASGAALAAERDALLERVHGLDAQLARAQSGAAASTEAKDKALAQAQDSLRTLSAERDALAAERSSLSARLKDAESQVARMTEELSRTQVELLNARAAGQDAEKQAQSGASERKDLAGRLKDAEAQIITLSENLSQAKAQLMDARAAIETAQTDARGRAAERLDLEARLKEAETQVMQLTGRMEALGKELSAARASAEKSAAQAKGVEGERMDLAGRLKEAEAQVIALAGEAQAARAQFAEADARRQEAERRGNEAVARAGEVLDEAKRQAKARIEALTAEREALTRLLAAHLSLTPDAVAALDAAGAFASYNKRFPALFGLAEADLALGIAAALPKIAARIQRPEAFVARVQELLAKPALVEEGLTLATIEGATLVFRSAPARAASGPGGRLLGFRDVSLEHDMENLVREIEGITRYELGQSLTAFIHLPQELLDDPATPKTHLQKLATIRDSGYRIVNTVNLAVDIFRMERGLYKMPAGRTLDLAVVARRAAKDVGQLAASRHVDLELLYGASPLPHDFALPGAGDPILAHALVANLLRDALEAAPRQSVVSATLARADETLRLEICRSGPVAAEEAACYFDKPLGEERESGLKRARYAAQLIAKSLGGTLAFRAEPQACTFTLTLPVVKS
jgi:chromosome segregation ATPase